MLIDNLLDISRDVMIRHIMELKKAKNAVLLAHYYQNYEVQNIADFVGDSLELSRKANQNSAEIIVFAGVHFMAETAKILNPSKKVLLPDIEAGCSLADSCKSQDLLTLKKLYPDYLVMAYINCSAEIKAISDIICTSSNALKILKSIPKEQGVIFVPDKNLGRYLKSQTNKKNMILWEGTCIVHQDFSIEKINILKKKHPDAKIIAHPESEEHVLTIADFIGSTSALLTFVITDTAKKFIVATEAGILHRMRNHAPEKIFIPAPIQVDNTCACSECTYMKKNTLEKLYICLRDENPEIIIEESLRKEALLPLQKMLNF